MTSIVWQFYDIVPNADPETRRYGQNARRVAINIRLEVHLELKI
jgi:hypothetical protein